MDNKVDIQLINSSNAYKVLSITGNKGDALKKHKVDKSALLLVREGSVSYRENNKSHLLSSGECQLIPANVFHEVICIVRSKFFVVLSNETKMKFKK